VTNTNQVKLVLNWYEIKGKNLVGEEPVKNLTADDMLKLFKMPFWNEIYHCWSIEPGHVDLFQANVDHHIDTKKYAYFVEIYKID
jgi:hypothetical protein